MQTTPAIVRTTAAPIRTTTTTRRVVTTQPKTSTQLVCYPGSSDPSCPRPTVGTRAPERVGPVECIRFLRLTVFLKITSELL